MSNEVGKIKERMIRFLMRSEPRKALFLYRGALRNSAQKFGPNSLDGLLWLFFNYRQRGIALEAVVSTHKAGYMISTAIACKILRGAYEDLVSDPQKAAIAIEWLQEGILKNGGMEQGSVETLLEVMKRMGRTDWVVEMFLSYRQGLAEGVVGESRIWGILISAVGEDGNLVGAREWFDKWRTGWITQYGESTERVPERPYLALLDQLIANTDSISAVPYLFLPLLQRDNVPLSTPIFNTLLRLELSRRQYLSLWGLWEKMDEGNWRKDTTSWKLALQAKRREDGSTRKRARVVGSRLQAIAGYSDGRSLQYRAIFSSFLLRHQLDTKHRPSLILPTSAIPIMSTTILNEFLTSFVKNTDWTAAIIVLDTFRVMSIEPDEITHGSTITGIVRAWERGRIAGEREFERGLGVERSPRMLRKGGAGAMAILNKILGQRKMRIALFTTPSHPSPPIEEDGLSKEEGRDKWDSIEMILNRPVEPPAWMKERELRDLGYLRLLLRSCSGISDEKEWERELTSTREELLPPRKREYDEADRKERATKHEARMTRR